VIAIRTCPAAKLSCQESFGAAYLVSVREPGTRARRPPWIAAHNFLGLCFRDTDNPDHPDAPRRRDVATLVKFARAVCAADPEAHVLVTCGGGVSRSSATAFVLLCTHLGPGKEAEALEISEASAVKPWIWPNRLMVQYADSLLKREGSMLAVLDAWQQKGAPPRAKRG